MEYKQYNYLITSYKNSMKLRQIILINSNNNYCLSLIMFLYNNNWHICMARTGGSWPYSYGTAHILYGYGQIAYLCGMPQELHDYNLDYNYSLMSE